MVGTPEMAREPLHTFRATDELWTEVKELATANGDTMSSILVAALTAYRELHNNTPTKGADNGAGIEEERTE